MMPGVTANSTDQLYIGNSAPAGTAATLPFSVNGNRNSANNWTVDGADNVDRGSNLTLMTFPSIDSIAEFKVERSLYTADTGRAGGAQINVVTKSGTNQYHGDLYEFVRNNAFAANNWINNAQKVLVNGSVQVPPLRWNDFGGTIGGPVPLGKKDNHKTFFFYSEEARRIHTYSTFNPVLPTQAMIQGTFSQPVCINLNIATATCLATGTQIHVHQSDCGRVHQRYLQQDSAFRDELRNGNFLRVLPRSKTSTTAGRRLPASTTPSTRSSRCGASSKTTAFPPSNRVACSRARRFRAWLPPTPTRRDALTWCTPFTASARA